VIDSEMLLQADHIPVTLGQVSSWPIPK